MGLFGKKSAQLISWNRLETENDFTNIIDRSFQLPQLIFKHSTRCSISSMALNRFERSWKELFSEKMDIHFLDLIYYRDTSNLVAEKTGIIHESPQVIVIKDGKTVISQSHNGIDLSQLINKV